MPYTVIYCFQEQRDRWHKVIKAEKLAEWKAERAERKRWAAAWRLRAKEEREWREREGREQRNAEPYRGHSLIIR